MCHIYEVCINKYKYIGSSRSKRKRRTSHLRFLKSNKHFNKKMQSVYNKYLDYNFNILEECLDETHMKIREEFYIKQYKENLGRLCMNILDTYGGGSEWRKYKTAEELKEHDRKRTQLSPEKRILSNKKHSDTIKSIPMEERRDWYNRAKQTRAKNIKNRKNYTPINIKIIYPDGSQKIENYDSESLFFKGTKLEETSLRQIKNEGMKEIKKRLCWTRHNFPVGTIIYKL